MTSSVPISTIDDRDDNYEQLKIEKQQGMKRFQQKSVYYGRKMEKSIRQVFNKSFDMSQPKTSRTVYRYVVWFSK